MTRLIRSRRVLLSGAAAITVAIGLAAMSASAMPGRSTAPRAGQAAVAAQLSASLRDHQAAGGRNTVLAGGRSTPLAHSRNRKQASGTFSDWPMFRGNPGHSGVSSETAISTTTAPTLTAGWTKTLGTSSYVSPAVATSSTLGEAVVYAAAEGKLRAYPATGGAAIWTFKTGGGAFLASPAVADGVVYAPSSAGIIYALNAATGAEECSYSTGGQLIQASPVVVSDPDGSGEVLYVGTDPPSSTGAEYAIYGAGNTHGSCTLDWKFTSWAESGKSGSWSPPAYATNASGTPVLVFGSDDPDDSVYALNATTGALVWRYQTSTAKLMDVGAAPTISAPGKNGFANGVVYALGKDKVLYAINLTTGKKIWSYALVKSSAAEVSSPALDGGTVYFGSNDGVYAVNARTGALVWHVLTSVFDASAAITGPSGKQVLVIGTVAGRIYALNLATGKTVWTARPITAGFWASPAISQGTIFVVGLDGVLRTYSPS